MPTPDITALTADLRILGGQRVWSLMTSLFGDLAQGEGDQIDGPVLSAIMSALEVKPEATRVALHRLRKDGWVTSVKSGRISRHSLTDKARRESVAASPRIYALPDRGPDDWQVVIFEDADAASQSALASRGFMQVLPRVFCGPAPQMPPAGTLVLAGDIAPPWLAAQLISKSLIRDYAKLHKTLSSLSSTLPAPSDLSALDISVLRCLIVHNWRRLVLKHPALPGGLVDRDGPLHLCHHSVAELLGRFERPVLSSIAQ